MFMHLASPWRHWQAWALGGRGNKKKPASAGLRRARMEPLEDRCLLSLNPTAEAQELLVHVNRMRVDPQAELAVLFSSTSPLVARDPGANAAINYFQDPTAAEILAEWQSLTPAAPLVWNEALYNAATSHSLLMRQYDQQGHQLPGEPARLGDRLQAAGYTNWSRVAENVFAYAASPFNAHSAFAIDWGVDTRGHRNNIMNPAYREIGIGVVADNSSSTQVGPLLVTQDFGNRFNFPGPFLVGVAYADSDGDRQYDAGEGLGGVRITATGAAGTFTATTMTAGGYQIQLPAGDYVVTASGGAFSGSGRVSAHVGADSVEVDFVSGLDTGYVNFDLWETPAEPLGTVDFLAIVGENPSARTLWYQFEAAYTGLLTVDATYDSSGGTAVLALYGAAGAELDRSGTGSGYQRVDALVSAGQTYLLEVAGTNSNVDLRLVNLVERDGTSVIVHGTADNDHFALDGTAGWNLSINGLTYQFAAAEATAFSFDGTGGSDDVRFVGTLGADEATLRPTSGTFAGSGYSLWVSNVESTDYDGAGGSDTVYVWGSAGANTYTAHPGSAEMTGDGVAIAIQAESIYARGGGGADTATVWDSARDDLFEFFPTWARAAGDGYYHHLLGFKTMFAEAAAGNDDVVFRGSDRNDWVQSTSLMSRMLTLGTWRHSRGFDTITAYGRGGADKLVLQDSPGEDTLKLTPVQATLTAPGYKVTAHAFGTVEATRVHGGDDRVTLEDSAGDDTLTGNPAVTTLSGPGYSNTVTGFPSVFAYSSGQGYDRAVFSDFTGESDVAARDDTFTASSLVGQLSATASPGLPGYLLWARLFDEVRAEARRGRDVAYLYGTTGAESLNGDAAEISLSGTRPGGEAFANYARAFDQVEAFAAGGQDRAVLDDTSVDLATYGLPAEPPLDELAQALWMRQFEEIELRTTATGQTTGLHGIDAVFASWQ